MDKMNKRQFLRKVAAENGMTIADTTRAYNAIIKGIQDTVNQGTVVSLTGFGTFYLQKHKGHPVQFEDTENQVNDYVVFKFSASDVLNKKFRQLYKRGMCGIE